MAQISLYVLFRLVFAFFFCPQNRNVSVRPHFLLMGQEGGGLSTEGRSDQGMSSTVTTTTNTCTLGAERMFILCLKPTFNCAVRSFQPKWAEALASIQRHFQAECQEQSQVGLCIVQPHNVGRK